LVRVRVKKVGLTLFFVLFCGIFGCKSPEEFKEEANEEVYSIIDSKWQAEFGGKANYKADITEKDPNVPLPQLPEDRILGLADAVAIATQFNRDYKTQKEGLYFSALDLTLVRHNFAVRWFGTIDADYVKTGDDESVSSDGELGFTKLFETGAAVSTSIAVDWTRFLTGSPRTSLGSVLSASLSQPLLRGSGRLVVTEGLTQAERNVLYQIRAFNRFRQDFVVSIVSDYYRILQLRDAVENAEKNYQRRLDSRERLEWEARAGDRAWLEVDQAQQDVLSAEDSIVQAKQNYQQALDNFKIRLGLAVSSDIELDQSELEALADMGVSDPNFSPDDAIKTALSERLDLANDFDLIDDALRKTLLAIDNLKGDLDFVASAGTPSQGKTDFTNLDFDDGTYNVGLRGDLPLDRKTERNAYVQTLINLQQQQRQYTLSEDRVILDVRQAYRELDEAAARYKIQQNSLELANSRVDSTQLLLDAGRGITRDLLEAQDALRDAENALTDALVAHAIAKLNFYKDIGLLQVRPDGMWEI